ncbi:MAG: hypothetical protein ACOCOT_05790 [Prevotella sp.]
MDIDAGSCRLVQADALQGVIAFLVGNRMVECMDARDGVILAALEEKVDLILLRTRYRLKILACVAFATRLCGIAGYFPWMMVEGSEMACM